MSKARFYKKNGEFLFECELEDNQEIILDRKRGFEEYLNQRNKPKNPEDYKKALNNFFQNLANNKLLLTSISIDETFIYKIKDSSTLQNLYLSMGSEYAFFNNNRDTNKEKTTNGAAKSCLGIYKDFLNKNEHINKSIQNTNYQLNFANNLTTEKTIQSLNQILYGPPGTGKTYHTIDKALEILGEYQKGQSQEERKQIFDDYRQQGQIEFVTLHQSYGYEEFVEGIKPIIDDDNDNLKYILKEGIFKSICNRAKENLENSKKSKEILQNESNIENTIADFFDELISKETKLTKTQGGEFSIKEIKNNKVYIQTKDTEINLGFPLKDFEKLILSDKNFKSSRELALDIFGEKNQSQIRTYMFHLYSKYREFAKNNSTNFTARSVEKIEIHPYILIIDEINRGNISKIFGELITLIEPSKRIGADEELQVTLPYSGELFGVPGNLYIIGTMNTADRSITALDTALRRRFGFVEMMPKPELLSKNTKGVNLQEMLKAINARIEFLLDREKTIGHAYFIGVKNIEELKSVFQNKIIPLLQEYFYNDYALIQAVLNDNKMIEEIENQQKTTITNCKGFKKLENLDLENKTIYLISDDEEIWNSPQTYIDIYER